MFHSVHSKRTLAARGRRVFWAPFRGTGDVRPAPASRARAIRRANRAGGDARARAHAKRARQRVPPHGVRAAAEEGRRTERDGGNGMPETGGEERASMTKHDIP